MWCFGTGSQLNLEAGVGHRRRNHVHAFQHFRGLARSDSHSLLREWSDRLLYDQILSSTHEPCCLIPTICWNATSMSWRVIW
jgi:hypothetical protein